MAQPRIALPLTAPLPAGVDLSRYAAPRAPGESGVDGVDSGNPPPLHNEVGRQRASMLELPMGEVRVPPPCAVFLATPLRDRHCDARAQEGLVGTSEIKGGCFSVN